MESKSPAVTVASVTNASATPHYYPSAAGLPLGHAERLVLQIVCSGGVTLTFEVSDDNSTWTDVTKSLASLNTGSTATSYVDKSDLLVFEGALFAQWRVKCVCSDATNAISIVATTAAGVVTKSGGGGGGGTVTGVTATAPIAASAGAAPVISWAPTTDVSMSSHKITSLTAGSASTDAVNVAQLQAVTAGITSRSVRMATVLALPTYVYANGTSGVGATITLTSTTAVISYITDGVSAQVGDRVLLKNGAAASDNGLYVITQRGDGASVHEIWTRVTDCDEAAELAAIDVTMARGDTLVGQTWYCYHDPDAFVVGSTGLTFSQKTTVPSLHASSHTTGSDQIADATTTVHGLLSEPALRAVAATLTAPLTLTAAAAPVGQYDVLRVSDTFGSGLYSARPAASALYAAIGYTYYATDGGGTMWKCTDASTWTQIALGSPSAFRFYGAYSALASATGMQAGDIARPSDSTVEWVYTGSLWVPLVCGGISGKAPPVKSQWSLRVGTDTLSDAAGSILLTCPVSTQFFIWSVPVTAFIPSYSGGDFTATIGVQQNICWPKGGGAGEYCNFAFGAGYTLLGNCIRGGLGNGGGAGAWTLTLIQIGESGWPSVTTGYYIDNYPENLQSIQFFKVQKAGAYPTGTFNISMSNNAVDWVSFRDSGSSQPVVDIPLSLLGGDADCLMFNSQISSASGFFRIVSLECVPGIV